MELLYWFQSIRNPLLDAFFALVTHFGEETFFILAGLIFFWCISKKEGFYLLCVGLTGTVLNQLLKLVFRVPRPWVRDPQFTIVEDARAAATGYSFPSGHTQSSVGIFGSAARWGGPIAWRILCIALCVLVPLSRLYLGVHTPADVALSVLLALLLIFAFYPLVRNRYDNPQTMRIALLLMIALAAGNLAFVSLYPFPADIDAANLTSGVKNAYKMLGCILALALSYEADHRFLRFDTRAPLPVQALKLILGLIPLLAIKALLKAPLQAVFANDYLADGVRYFLMTAFAGCIWPMTFPFLCRLYKK